MLATVSSIVLPLLFTATGTLATTVLVSGWRRYGPNLARLRAELAALAAAEAEAAAAAERELRRAGAAVVPSPRRSARPVRAAAAARPAPAGLRAAA